MCLNKVIPQEHVTVMDGFNKNRLYQLSTTVLNNPVWLLALRCSELFKRQCGFGILWELKMNGKKTESRQVFDTGMFVFSGNGIIVYCIVAT